MHIWSHTLLVFQDITQWPPPHSSCLMLEPRHHYPYHPVVISLCYSTRVTCNWPDNVHGITLCEDSFCVLGPTTALTERAPCSSMNVAHLHTLIVWCGMQFFYEPVAGTIWAADFEQKWAPWFSFFFLALLPSLFPGSAILVIWPVLMTLIEWCCCLLLCFAFLCTPAMIEKKIDKIK